ncbi:MAG: tRNA (adenosine(37)-N6)-threonylcarbamoyltransferase complex ATPase subunit type 1 TsaE [Actinomycetota bacterium]|nr:tRNA (adenosine(37)-N6)-threonylcarbamoyltransferase complex ATPase subunit type 1 TsaE [Actinomycetota bacterium]
MTVDLPTAASTFEFGRDRLAPLFEPGDLVIVSGRLGVGKTALIQGIGAGLLVGEPVLSPTFVIARVHRGGRIPLVHVDAYRLGSVREIDDLDLDADVDASVTAVEWGEGLVEHLVDEHLLIALSLAEDAGGELRTATLTPYGPGWRARLPATMGP